MSEAENSAKNSAENSAQNSSDHAQSKSTLSKLAGKVLELLEADLASDGFELLDVRIFQGGGRFQVRIYVDLIDGGISLDQCTKAARTSGMLLEEADLFLGQYVVEVSSPGIRRPLRKLSHFEAATGQKVDIKLRPGAGRSKVRGLLTEVDGHSLMVIPAGKTEEGDEPESLAINWEDVIEASLDPEFDAKALINADRRQRREDRREERRAKGKKKRKGRPKAGKTAPPKDGANQDNAANKDNSAHKDNTDSE